MPAPPILLAVAMTPLSGLPQEVVDLPAADTPLCVSSEPLFRSDDNLSIVTSVGFDRDGNIRVGDFARGGGLRVVFASPEGDLSRFGLEGPGPGEFASATHIVALANGPHGRARHHAPSLPCIPPGRIV